MKVYIVQINLQVMPGAYTSLKELCDKFALNYSSASKGARLFVRSRHVPMQIFIITECEVIKIKGRENNAKKKAK